eukprot:TRINITY_DN78678_c0_g1_i1.p1 TRINITY_DN78678_c0_g1~~TRINITY_DN78678_c0_g1_i1.p1  ORF type:complete len:238 (-),score=32.14 TRINITY_DN78678_c0_g1_i1:151-768(-)
MSPMAGSLAAPMRGQGGYPGGVAVLGSPIASQPHRAVLQPPMPMPPEAVSSATSSSSWPGSNGVMRHPSTTSSASSYHRRKTSSDFQRRMMVKVFLDQHGFMHINEAKHSWGRTYYPLHVAVRQNNLPVVQALLQMGASTQCASTRGYTPEDIAKRRNSRWGGYDEVVHVLESAQGAGGNNPRFTPTISETTSASSGRTSFSQTL